MKKKSVKSNDDADKKKKFGEGNEEWKDESVEETPDAENWLKEDDDDEEAKYMGVEEELKDEEDENY